MQPVTQKAISTELLDAAHPQGGARSSFTEAVQCHWTIDAESTALLLYLLMICGDKITAHYRLANYHDHRGR